jgi:succinyl-CoA synthetase alpha subunit
VLEAALQTAAAGLGEPALIDLGGAGADPQVMAEALDQLLSDPETSAIVVLGMVDGDHEFRAAARLGAVRRAKPVVAHLYGAPPPRGSADVVPIWVAKAARKIDALRRAGVVVATSPAEIGQILATLLAMRGARTAGRASDDFLAAVRQAERDVYDAV